VAQTKGVPWLQLDQKHPEHVGAAGPLHPHSVEGVGGRQGRRSRSIRARACPVDATRHRGQELPGVPEVTAPEGCGALAGSAEGDIGAQGIIPWDHPCGWLGTVLRPPERRMASALLRPANGGRFVVHRRSELGVWNRSCERRVQEGEGSPRGQRTLPDDARARTPTPQPRGRCRPPLGTDHSSITSESAPVAIRATAQMSSRLIHAERSSRRPNFSYTMTATRPVTAR
jgi:hypothetical protein